MISSTPTCATAFQVHDKKQNTRTVSGEGTEGMLRSVLHCWASHGERTTQYCPILTHRSVQTRQHKSHVQRRTGQPRRPRKPAENSYLTWEKTATLSLLFHYLRYRLDKRGSGFSVTRLIRTRGSSYKASSFGGRRNTLLCGLLASTRCGRRVNSNTVTTISAVLT